eukprot:9033660-Alexandrium_andersonii.AAC.1
MDGGVNWNEGERNWQRVSCKADSSRHKGINKSSTTLPLETCTRASTAFSNGPFDPSSIASSKLSRSTPATGRARKQFSRDRRSNGNIH